MHIYIYVYMYIYIYTYRYIHTYVYILADSIWMSINLQWFINACTRRCAYVRLHIFSLTAHVQAWGTVGKLRVRGRGAHRSISCGCHLLRFLVSCLRLPSTRFCGILFPFTNIFTCTANPIWSDIFESSCKAQRPKLERLFCHVSLRKGFRSFSF